MSERSKTVGVIGLGNMGLGMAANLAAKGFVVSGYARKLEAKEALLALGAASLSSAAAVGERSDVVFLMVMNAAQVMDLLQGGLKDAMRPGSTLIVTATIGRHGMLAVDELLRGTGIGLLDCPVSGGKGGADGGTLTLMAAGAKEVFDAQQDVLAAIAGKIFHVGEAIGQGQAVKACLQALIGVTFEGLFETMVLGAKAGIDPETLSAVINGSFVGSKLTQSTTAFIVNRQFSGTGSHIGTMHKDFGLSMDMARELGVPMPATSVAMQMFQAGLSALPDGDNWCIVQLLEKLAATEIRNKAAA
jgi:putative dehydrogenase